MAPYSDCTSASWAGWGQTSVILGSEGKEGRRFCLQLSLFIPTPSPGKGLGTWASAGPFCSGVSVFSLALLISGTGGNCWTDRGTGPLVVRQALQRQVGVVRVALGLELD